MIRHTRNRHHAEDVVQDTFVKAAENIDKFKAGSDIGTWFYRIARNRANSDFRKAKVRKADSFSNDAVAEPISTTDDHLIHREKVADVRAALANLPTHYSEPLRLKECDGMTYEQIAGQLGINLGTVRSRISRAKAMLRTEIAA